MTALAINDPAKFNEGDFDDHPVLAGAVIFEGSRVSITAAGWAKAYAGTDVLYAGICVRKVDNTAGANGDLRVHVRRGRFYANGKGAAFVQADVGTALFVSDDNVHTLTAASNLAVGTVARLISGTEIEVKNVTDV